MTTLPKALFFDVFGTLVDWRSSIAREAQTILENSGLTVKRGALTLLGPGGNALASIDTKTFAVTLA